MNINVQEADKQMNVFHQRSAYTRTPYSFMSALHYTTKHNNI